jgi:hypothetical protein
LSDILKKLCRTELRQLKPGDWVVWSTTGSWDTPANADCACNEAQVVAHPVRSGHEVVVLFNGLAHAVQKNRLYKVLPIISVEDMHQQYDYNS